MQLLTKNTGYANGVPCIFCGPQMRGIERSTQNNPANCLRTKVQKTFVELKI